MRTSRVGNVLTSTYRNAKRYLETEDAFINVMNDRDALNHFNRQQQDKQNASQRKKAPVKKVNLVNNRHHVLIKGIQYDGDTAAIMRNRLLRQAIMVSYATKMKRRNHTYRTSI
ncbi:hypothetical protein [Lysinibacillus sp. 54212]|uniref:hypothetical protein n=1 Tax=Lysinibacillus sp. 54212 TaxID=3119829 RepID=UPI002FCB9292